MCPKPELTTVKAHGKMTALAAWEHYAPAETAKMDSEGGQYDGSRPHKLNRV
jgi:hypothetical protein